MESADPDPRRAITDRREEIAAGPHPKPLFDLLPAPDDGDDEVHRLYRSEWVIAYTAVATPDGYDPDELEAVCRKHFDLRYTGRVLELDARVQVDGDGPGAIGRLMLRLPVMKGEFKTAEHAYEFGRAQGWADRFVVVARNSKSDHHLRSYGTKKLSAPAP